MNFRFHCTSAHLLALVLLTSPLSVMAKEKAAYGEFTADYNKCISEEVFVHARSSEDSGHANVTISIYRQDVCRDQPLLIVRADKAKLKKGKFLVDDELSVASLNGTITVSDKSTRERYQVRLSLSWRADGDIILADKNRVMTEAALDEEELSKTADYKIAYRDAWARGIIEINGDQMNFSASRGASLVSTDLKQLDDETSSSDLREDEREQARKYHPRR